jgi:hypothetical protein
MAKGTKDKDFLSGLIFADFCLRRCKRCKEQRAGEKSEILNPKFETNTKH